MPEDHTPTISSSRLNATEVARHTFGTVRRGLDPQEVRAYLELVAREMQTWEQREQELRADLADANERARNPVLDEATLTNALGQQSAQLLRHAHQEAARITSDADERAGMVLRESQTEASEVLVRAETASAERIAEAELAVAQVHQEAAAEARAMQEAAQADGEQLLERAREHGRRVVEEAQAARRRVLNDLAQRRRALYSQIEQLRAARDQLGASVLGVRDVVDGIARDLSHAEQEAREAAAEAARRADAEGLPANDELLVQDVDTSADTPDLRGGPGAEGAPAAEAADGAEGAVRAEPAGPEPGGDATPARGVEVAGAEEPAPVPEPGTGGERGAQPVVDAAYSRGDVVVVVEEERPTEARSEAGQSLPETSVPEAGAAEGGEADSIDSKSLEELFARIRASQQAAAESGRIEPPVPESGEPGSGPGAAEEERARVVHLRRRDEALEPIVAQLARRLKRALADDQNQLLDRLRSTNGAWTPEVLVAEEDHAAEIAAAVLDPLREAAEVGRSLAGDAGDQVAVVPMEGLAEELGLTVVRRLRRRLPGGEDGPAVADVDDATEVVGAAYRSWRGQRVETLAGDFAVAAAGDAVVVVAGKSAPLEWIVGAGHPPCADCEDNSLAGAVPAGEEYPTGHLRPPAHPGCRCAVAPAAAPS